MADIIMIIITIIVVIIIQLYFFFLSSLLGKGLKAACVIFKVYEHLKFERNTVATPVIFTF